MSSILTSYQSTIPEFDPATMHPASLLSLKEASALSDRVVNGSFATDEMHPASLPSSSRLVKDGYGELVLRVREGRTLRPVTKDEYAQAYRIFQKYAPRLEADPRPLASRIEMMREELKTINPNMVATFIPRTLFELLYIKKSIEEDLKKENEVPHHELEANLWKNSWCFYGENGSTGLEIRQLSDREKHLPILIDIGYRLNQVAIEEIDRLGKNIEDLSYGQIQRIRDRQIGFLERFGKGLSLIASHSKNLLSQNFSPWGTLSLKHDDTKKLLKKAIFLECQESSSGKILLYRAGNLETDYPLKFGKAYSISFGMSLFAGVIKDRGACAYYYSFTQRNKRDSYALRIDPAVESSRMFHILPLTAVEALLGSGEMFHCRYLCSREEEDIIGVDLNGDGFDRSMNTLEKYKLLKNPFSRAETTEKFEALMEKNLFLFLQKAPDEINVQ